LALVDAFRYIDDEDHGLAANRRFEGGRREGQRERHQDCEPGEHLEDHLERPQVHERSQ
jgi:hypothetical protein